MGNALSRPINESFKYRYARIPPYGERKGHPCSPAQRSLDDIPVICFDVSKKRRTRRFIRFIRARIRRAQKWSHERYYGKSVTPMWNPSNPKINYTKEEMAKNPKLKGKNPNTGYGYHIVELTNKRKNSNKVQLLFNDFNKYLSAFRSFKDGKWSRWYRCSDTEIPDYFDAISMGVDGCHGAEKSTIGGDETLDDIFNTLWSFPYKETRKGDLKRALMRAVVVFSETLRLILVYHIVVRRMQFNSKSFPLPAIAWGQITSWGNLGEFALETGCENKGYVNYCKFNSFVRPHGIVDFEHLIVHRRSAVMVIQWKGEQLLPCGWKESNHKLLVGKPGRPGGNRVLEDVETSFVPSPPVSPYETHNARRAARVARREAQRQSDKQLYAYTRPPRTAPNERYDTSEAKREARIARKAARREEERRIREDITRTIRYGEFGEIGEEFLQGLLDTIELELAAAAAGHLYNPIPNQELGQD